MKQKTLGDYQSSDCSPRAGVIAGTDILTESGFRPVSALSQGDSVGVLVDGERLDYRPIESIRSGRFRGNVHHYKGRPYDLTLTPQQKIYCRNTSGVESFGDWRLKKSIEVKRRQDSGSTTTVEIKRNFDWGGRSTLPNPFSEERAIQNNTIRSWPEIGLSGFLKLLGWYLGDGSAGAYDHETRGVAYTVRIRFARERTDEITGLIENLGLSYHLSEDKTMQVHIHSQQFYEYLRRFGKAADKYIPAQVKGLSRDLLDPIYEGLLISDGCHDTRSKERGQDFHQFIWKSRRLANDLQEIALKRGRLATMFQIDGSDYNPDGVYWRVNVSDRSPTPNLNQVEVKPYDGGVVTFDSGGLPVYARQNGKTAWIGA